MADSPSTGKTLTIAGLTTAAIGGPAGLGFTEWAWANRWLALPLIALWELVLLVADFALDVWEKVRPSVVGRAAETLTFWLDCLLLGCRKAYLEDVVYQHRNFDVKGLSTQATYTLELEQVFVDLSVAPMPPDDASADMLRPRPSP